MSKTICLSILTILAAVNTSLTFAECKKCVKTTVTETAVTQPSTETSALETTKEVAMEEVVQSDQESKVDQK